MYLPEDASPRELVLAKEYYNSPHFILKPDGTHEIIPAASKMLQDMNKRIHKFCVDIPCIHDLEEVL